MPKRNFILDIFGYPDIPYPVQLHHCAEGNEFIKYATGAPIELEDTDTTFSPIEWWIGKVSSLSYPLPIRPR